MKWFFDPVEERETNWNFTGCEMPHFMVVSIPHINLLNLSSYILKISSPENENFQIKNSDIFLISAQNIDCGYSLELPRWGSSNEYPQSMFLSRNKKNNVYSCKPQFYYIKVGFKGGGQNYIHVGMFSWWEMLHDLSGDNIVSGCN